MSTLLLYENKKQYIRIATHTNIQVFQFSHAILIVLILDLHNHLGDGFMKKVQVYWVKSKTMCLWTMHCEMACNHLQFLKKCCDQLTKSSKAGLSWKIWWLILFNFIVILPNSYFWNKNQALDYVYAQFLHFPEISPFTMILSLN